MSNLTIGMLRDTLAECDLIMRPWAPLIGLIEWRESEWCDEGAIYVLSPNVPGFALPDSVLCRSVDQVAGMFPHVRTRTELAAYLFWAIREASKGAPR
jgi:hypothetical protein